MVNIENLNNFLANFFPTYREFEQWTFVVIKICQVNKKLISLLQADQFFSSVKLSQWQEEMFKEDCWVGWKLFAKKSETRWLFDLISCSSASTRVPHFPVYIKNTVWERADGVIRPRYNSVRCSHCWHCPQGSLIPRQLKWALNIGANEIFPSIFKSQWQIF